MGLIGKTLGGWPCLETLGVNVLRLKAKIKKENGDTRNPEFSFANNSCGDSSKISSQELS